MKVADFGYVSPHIPHSVNGNRMLCPGHVKKRERSNANPIGYHAQTTT